MRTEGSTTPSAGTGEVRPEELTELVERLHQREERLSVGDVAETLGVSAEQVEATLRAMRSERVPPVSKERQKRSPWRKRVRVTGGVISVAVLIAGISFSMGHRSGIRAGYSPPSMAPYGTPSYAEELRVALPHNMSVSIGKVTYTGRPGTVFADESRLADLINALIAREVHDAPQTGVGLRASSHDVLQALRSGRWGAVDGLEVRKLKVTHAGENLEVEFPKLMRSFAPARGLREALNESRYAAARTAANRLTEWAEVGLGKP